MTSAAKKLYAVITADIRGSRAIANFRRERDAKLKPLTRLHLDQKLIVSEYAVTAWDEFEGLTTPRHVPTVLFDLRRCFHPLQLWIGVGVGEVSEPNRRPINVFAGGEAFERARFAIDQIKSRYKRFPRWTVFVSGNSRFDLVANTIYHLHDTLIQGVSSKQWRTINAQVSLQSQEQVAKKLRLDESTVSRNLRRGFYAQMTETRTTMEVLMTESFEASCTKKSKL
jgi:hypothetical protein